LGVFNKIPYNITIIRQCKYKKYPKFDKLLPFCNGQQSEGIARRVHVIDDIISRSLESQAVPVMKKPSSRISFRSLSHIIMMLNKTFKKASSSENQLLYVQPEDIDYRRYPEAIKYYQWVVGIQAKRIKTLEHDLRTLVNLARETQKMLADIAAEKRVTEERGHGEPAI
ncbi:hypothetical protein M5D96_003486, partial [Drosophila gunungcola]